MLKAMIRRLDDLQTDYAGLEMTAEEYFALGETQERYELIDGVVRMSPGPLPVHGAIVAEVTGQIWHYLQTHPVGRIFPELDVHLGQGPTGGDLVYRPDILFLRAERVKANCLRVVDAPDVVVEVISPSSRRFDRQRKKADYERFGVGEYWVFDPEDDTVDFFRLLQGGYVDVFPDGDFLTSKAIPGFVLNLARVRMASRLD